MSIVEIHARLASTASLFLIALTVWSVYFGLRNRALDSSWRGAAAIAEVLLIVEALLGILSYSQGFGTAMARPILHMVYGVVALITLPAAFMYYGNIENPRWQAWAMAATCLFLWGLVQRLGFIATFIPPTLAGS